jgi:uncharacterized protein (TIGR01244 family)
MSGLEIMMLSPEFGSAAQVESGDFAFLAEQGFRSVINNRPDGEGGVEQPRSDSLASAASHAGIEYAYLPVIPSEITPEVVAQFAMLLATLPKPILAFCKSGGRANRLYQLASGA